MNRRVVLKRFVSLGCVGLVLVLSACGGGSSGAAAGEQTPAANPSPSSGSASGAGSTGATGTGNTGSGTSGTSGSTTATSSSGPSVGACPMFPDTAIFNTRIDDATRFPVHAKSSAWIQAVGASRRFHADWGSSTDQQQPDAYYGIPYNVVDGSASTTIWPVVDLSQGVPEESDCAASNGSGGYDIHRGCNTLAATTRRFPYPVSSLLKIEGGACNNASCGDHHVLVVEQGACHLWESYASGIYSVNGQWQAYGTAAWDLKSNAMRPDTWTSTDAAGLPILPLIARADEAGAGEIKHALRVTFGSNVIGKTYVWPARHRISSATGTMPMGTVLRLKSGFVIPANWTTQAKALALAMQRYGLYVADIGSNLFVQGEPNATWQDATISQIQTITMDQFEFVDLSGITTRPGFDGNSFAATW